MSGADFCIRFVYMIALGSYLHFQSSPNWFGAIKNALAIFEMVPLFRCHIPENVQINLWLMDLLGYMSFHHVLESAKHAPLTQVSECNGELVRNLVGYALAMLLIRDGAGKAEWLHGVRLFAGRKNDERLE